MKAVKAPDHSAKERCSKTPSSVSRKAWAAFQQSLEGTVRFVNFKDRSFTMKLVRVTSCLVVLLLSLVAFTFVGVHPSAAQTLNPPPPTGYSCNPVGNGTICRADVPNNYTLVDTGIVCGSGASAFDIYDSATGDQQKTRYYDQNGNLTRRVIHETYSSGQFSNPLTGAVVPYTQHDTITDVLAGPGDLSTATTTNVGENIFKPAQGAPVFKYAGRFVTAPDGTIEFQAGQNDFFKLMAGDTSVLQKLCAALS
jgi:hypothetical protein